MNSSPPSPAQDTPRLLKKYPNRRLYDSHSSSYITLADVKNMVLESTPFQVLDAKTGDNLTRSILLQIILEEESAGSPLFSEALLCGLIRFYGQTMQSSVGSWLELSLSNFAKMQESLGSQWQNQLKQIPALPTITPLVNLPALNPLQSTDWMQHIGQHWQAQQDQLQQTQAQFLAQLQSLQEQALTPPTERQPRKK